MAALPEIAHKFHGIKYNPHAVLGLHPLDERNQVIRLWRPGASKVYLELKGQIVEARKVDHDGLFEYQVPRDFGPLDYKVYHRSGFLAYDPYVFLPTFGELHAHLFARGVHYRLFDVLGAKIVMHHGVEGTQFAVWAPSAKEIAIV